MIAKHKSIFHFACLIIFGFLVVLNADATAATYYVDFESGSDANNGTASGSPFKHCPGDSAAQGVAASTTLSPGDTVLFRGGVKYRGQISLTSSGSVGFPITYKGNGWGTEKAIITGADVYPNAWTACESQAACRNNSNWQNIFYSALPAGKTFFNRLLQNNEFLWFSQSPNPSRRIFWNTLGDWYVIPYGSSIKRITSISITDPDVFTQPNGFYYNDAYVVYWGVGNTTSWGTINSYNTSTSTINITTTGQAPYPDRNNYYTLLNIPASIDQAGEYAFSPTDNKVYLWSFGNANPNNEIMEIANRYTGFSGNIGNVTIDGFKITGIYGDLGVWWSGGGISLTGGPNIKIINCELSYLSSPAGMNSIRISSNNSIISNNIIQDNFVGRGIIAFGDNVLVDNNIVRRIGGTGIWFSGTTNSKISRNIVSDMQGIHANGISVYSASNNAIVEKNLVENMVSLFTFEQSENITVKNNIFDGYGIGTINEWGGMTGFIRFINNTMVNGEGNNMLKFSGSNPSPTRVVINNVIDGGSGTIHSNNIYTDYNNWQYPNYGWSLGVGESKETELKKLFVDPTARNYHPLIGGPLIGRGTNVSVYGVGDDIEGNSRLDRSWDIGAYIGPMMPKTKPSGNLRISN